MSAFIFMTRADFFKLMCIYFFLFILSFYDLEIIKKTLNKIRTFEKLTPMGNLFPKQTKKNR